MAASWQLSLGKWMNTYIWGHTAFLVILFHMNLKHAHLADDVPVGETDNHPVLWCVVLVLILYNKALASKVVSLSL